MSGGPPGLYNINSTTGQPYTTPAIIPVLRNPLQPIPSLPVLRHQFVTQSPFHPNGPNSSLPLAPVINNRFAPIISRPITPNIPEPVEEKDDAPIEVEDSKSVGSDSDTEESIEHVESDRKYIPIASQFLVYKITIMTCFSSRFLLELKVI